MSTENTAINVNTWRIEISPVTPVGRKQHETGTRKETGADYQEPVAPHLPHSGFNCVGRLFEHEVYLRLVDLDKPQSEVLG